MIFEGSNGENVALSRCRRGGEPTTRSFSPAVAPLHPFVLGVRGTQHCSEKMDGFVRHGCDDPDPMFVRVA